MKYLIVLACLLAIAYADDERSAVSEGEYSEVNPDGFKYNWKTSNHINVEQSGHLKDEHTQEVHGSYEYVAPNGHTVHVTYVADEHGYHPTVHV